MAFNKAINFVYCVEPAIPNDHRIAHYLQVFDPVLLILGQPPAFLPLHFTPKLPRGYIKVRHPLAYALALQLSRCCLVPMPPVGDSKDPDSWVTATKFADKRDMLHML